jgi:hypothetical protein
VTVTPFPQRYPALPRNASFTRYPVPLSIGTGNGNAPQHASPTGQSVTLNLWSRVDAVSTVRNTPSTTKRKKA